MHLLPIQSRTVDDEAAPVDLDLTPADILLLSFTDTDLAVTAAAWDAEREVLPSLRLIHLGRLKHPYSVDLFIEKFAAPARFVIVRLLGGADYWRYGVDELAAAARRGCFALAMLPGCHNDDPRLADASTVSADMLAELRAYFEAGGVDNARQALRMVASSFSRNLAVQPPRPVAFAGLYGHACRAGEGAHALILFYRSALLAADTVPIIALADALKARGARVVALYVTSLKDPETIDFLASWLGKNRPDVILNTTAFSARDEHGCVLDPADVPVLQAVLSGADHDGWLASPRGLGPADLAMNVVLPEVDGRLAAGTISFKATTSPRPELEFSRTMHHPDAAGISHAADLAMAWAALRRTPRAERRLACILPDYPGKDGRAGYAIGLDAEASLSAIAAALGEAGFDVGLTDGTGEAPEDLESGQTRPSSESAPSADLDSEAASLPASGRGARVTRDGWGRGTPKSSRRSETGVQDAAPCALDRLEPLPGSHCPPFGRYAPRNGEGGEPAYDDRLASEWIASDRRPPGGSGLMRRLSEAEPRPVLTVADYTRAFAALPLTFAAAVTAAWGAADDDPDCIDGAFHLRFLRTGKLIVALQPDRGSADNRRAEFHDPALPPRHGYIAFYLWLRQVERCHALINLGTHGTLEWLPGKAVALGPDCAPRVLAGATPVIYPFIVNNPGEAAQAKRRIGAVTIGHLTPPLVEAGTHGDTAVLEQQFDEYAEALALDPRRARLLGRSILQSASERGLLPTGAERAKPEDALATLDNWLCDIKEARIADGLHIFGRSPASRGSLEAGIEGLDAALSASGPAERDGLLRALDGRFVIPGPSGAPDRGRTDVLPTGRNLYSMDPRALPTRTAWEMGARLADELATRYAQDNGEWPRRIVLNLWGSATMRTGGDDLAQAFALMGVRPRWDHGSGRVNGFEILPLARLGRARIDVTLRISGLFRDAFPDQIALFGAAVRAVAALDETDEDNALAEARRREHTLLRVFGAAPGAYGVGIARRLEEDPASERASLGEVYLAAASHAFDTPSQAEATSAFRDRVAATDAFSHTADLPGQDLLESDTIAEHQGGFAAAASLLGAEPTLYHTDTSRAGSARLRPLADAITGALHARATNPRWVEGQMRHGHRGAIALAETLDALYAYAATTEVVPSQHFDRYFDATLGDTAVRAFLERENPAVARAMARKFQAALDCGHWTSRRNSVADTLCEISLGGDASPDRLSPTGMANSAHALALTEAVP